MIKMFHWGIGGLLVCCLLFLAESLMASTLREDYKTLQAKRRMIEQERRQYENKFREVSAKRNRLNLSLYQCISSNWKSEWEEKMVQAKTASDLLEAERVKLVNIRVELDKIRNDLETLRADIEERYKLNRNKDYEAEFRQYMNDLNIQYFDRISTELFSGYIQYLEGVEAHLIFLQESLDECQPF